MNLRETKPFKDLIEGLVGRTVTVAYSTMVDPDVPNTVGVYVNPTEVMTAVVLLDKPLTAYLGAALGLLPPGRAADSLEEDTIPEDLQENAGEVLNVLAAVLGDALGVHQRLDATYAPTDALPGPVHAFAGTTRSRLDMELDVDGYGPGKMSVVAFEPDAA